MFSLAVFGVACLALHMSVSQATEFCESGAVAAKDAYMLEASWGKASQVSQKHVFKLDSSCSFFS